MIRLGLRNGERIDVRSTTGTSTAAAGTSTTAGSSTSSTGRTTAASSSTAVTKTTATTAATSTVAEATSSATGSESAATATVTAATGGEATASSVKMLARNSQRRHATAHGEVRDGRRIRLNCTRIASSSARHRECTAVQRVCEHSWELVPGCERHC
jgi:hypothetical protein